MDDLWTTVTLPDLGATALLTAVVIMILTDRLVTRRRLDDAQSETQHWRDAYDGLVDERAEEREQMRTLIEATASNSETSELAVQLLRALREDASRSREG